MDCSENRHEGGHGRCRRNGIVGFGNECVNAREMPLLAVWWLKLSDLDKSRHERGHGRCRQNCVVEVRDCNENWYEGGHGRCRRNDIVKFGITHAPST